MERRKAWTPFLVKDIDFIGPQKPSATKMQSESHSVSENKLRKSELHVPLHRTRPQYLTGGAFHHPKKLPPSTHTCLEKESVSPKCPFIRYTEATLLKHCMVSHHGEIRIFLHINYKCPGNFSVFIGMGPRLRVPTPWMKLTKNSWGFFCSSNPEDGAITKSPPSPWQA